MKKAVNRGIQIALGGLGISIGSAAVFKAYGEGVGVDIAIGIVLLMIGLGTIFSGKVPKILGDSTLIGTSILATLIVGWLTFFADIDELSCRRGLASLGPVWCRWSYGVGFFVLLLITVGITIFIIKDEYINKSASNSNDNK